jgi:hypothetical protein
MFVDNILKRLCCNSWQLVQSSPCAKVASFQNWAAALGSNSVDARLVMPAQGTLIPSLTKKYVNVLKDREEVIIVLVGFSKRTNLENDHRR